ncbi:TetR family transcriptional regulator [Actinomadura logoneensis]|uniref:TetR family transcriptional regulator n=1 Tax=Actinomadura logoneensis TaxID=2293572 RepID=A0A372JU13_9ACTN|nr:TetR family transcriptional regulator [Actinomadura logoneensis]RFU43296.1 TetR family transcriptional regulator [Actinomadura logoneensis]
MTAETEGVRARKKRRTRLAISHAATRLFLERGFERVTIAEIAEAAGVAKMTVTNYFPRKEDLALDIHAEFVSWPAATVRGRAPGESALAALRRAYLDAVGRRAAVAGFSGEPFARMLLGSPTLVARIRELHEEREHALAEALDEAQGEEPSGTPGEGTSEAQGEGASETPGAGASEAPAAGGAQVGGDRPGLLPRLAAAQLGGVHRVLFDEALRRTADGRTHEEIAAELTRGAARAFDLLEPSLGGYAVRADG